MLYNRDEINDHNLMDQLDFKILHKIGVIWEYHNKIIKSINNLTEYNFERTTVFTLQPTSKLYNLLSNRVCCPGVFNTRRDYISIFINIQQRDAVIFNLLDNNKHEPCDFNLDASGLLLSYSKETERILISLDHNIGNILNTKFDGDIQV